MYKNGISENCKFAWQDFWWSRFTKIYYKKWTEVYDQSERNCNFNKEIRIKTPMLRSDLCDFSDAYIVVKGIIGVINLDNAKRNKVVAFKNTPFINCISKINGV